MLPQKLRIGIVGDGNVGSALRTGLQGAGHEVQAVGNDPQRVRELGRWAELVILAVPFGARADAVRELGEALRGKVLVDVTNSLGPQRDFAVDVDESGAEQLQTLARGAVVVKAFNTVFAKHLSTGHVHGERLTAFVAGDDAGAKARVLQLGRDLGFDAVDAGPLEHARWLETLGFLNLTLGYKVGLGPDIGFRLVRPVAPRLGLPEAAPQT